MSIGVLVGQPVKQADGLLAHGQGVVAAPLVGQTAGERVQAARKTGGVGGRILPGQLPVEAGGLLRVRQGLTALLDVDQTEGEGHQGPAEPGTVGGGILLHHPPEDVGPLAGGIQSLLRFPRLLQSPAQVQ